MPNHFDLTDETFEIEFESCSLDPILFTHEAHLRLAWIHINKYGLSKAIKNINLQLVAFVKAAGASEKYNVTLTTAAIKIVYHFKAKSRSKNFKDFILEFPQLKTRFKELLMTHYSEEIISSGEAKNSFVEPDLMLFN